MQSRILDYNRNNPFRANEWNYLEIFPKDWGESFVVPSRFCITLIVSSELFNQLTPEIVLEIREG